MFKYAALSILGLSTSSLSHASATPVTSLNQLVSVFMSLLLVVISILALAWLVKKLNPNLIQQQDFKVIRSISLGSKERLLVVELDNKHHLLGVTSNSINYLYQLDEKLEAIQSAEFAPKLASLLAGKTDNNKEKKAQ
jgi:flagellar protein FliO/FliZ